MGTPELDRSKKLELLPEAPTALGEPTAQERRCEACGHTVRFLTVKSPDGSPDFVRALFPQEAWFGWTWSGLDGKALAIVVLCSRSCHVEWFDAEHGPGV